MPSVPYAPSSVYTPNHSIGEILRQQAEVQANRAAQQGQISGQMWGNVGNQIAGTIGSILQERRDAPLRAQEAAYRAAQTENLTAQAGERQAATQAQEQARAQDAAFMQLMQKGPPDPNAIIGIYGPERGSKIAQGLVAFSELQSKQVADARGTAGRLATGFSLLSPDLQQAFWPGVRQAAIKAGLGDEQSIPQEPRKDFLDAVIKWAGAGAADYTLNPGDTRMSGQTNTSIATGAPRAEPVTPAPAPFTLSEGQVRYGPDGKVLARGPAQSPSATTQEPLVPIIGPDGQPVLVPRSQAVGKRPASNREQGRPVTSGDAGRMADFDTSLSDLTVLNATLTETKGATGTSAAIGAAMPAWATDTFGWGTDAKKRQGVIDRVKQVIGKVLEGGVLRKEDEIKYSKILPTIKDTAEVAASKLAGLKTAIDQRRSTFLDALEDANYDVGKFKSRTPATTTTTTDDAAAKAQALIDKYSQ